jgi:6-phosphogluconolactonase
MTVNIANFKIMIKIFNNTNEIAEAIAQILFELIEKKDIKPIHIALSGGNTPKLIFSYLSEMYGTKLADKRFHFWWGDERCVPSDDNECNYKWANELWLNPIGIATTNIHRIQGENTPEIEAIRYSEEMKNYIEAEEGWPRFDLITLGLGDDGHTASIFPNQMNLLTSENWCEVANHPVSGQKRITFTGKVINNARKVVFISTSENKAQMVRNIVIEVKPEYPASHIQPKNGELIWLLDKNAAQFI